MRVLHVGKYYPPIRGGLETAMEAICVGLAARGAQVTALVAGTSRRTSIEVRHGVRVVRAGRITEVRSQPICPDFIDWLHRWDGDVVHLHLPNPLAALNALFARPHGVWLALYHSDILRQQLLRPAADAVQRRFLERCAAITVPTPAHVDCSPILRRFSQRCRVIHFGIDPSRLAQPSPGADAGLPEGITGRPLLLFVGRLVYYKGVDVLLEAVASVPEATAVIVGDGPLRHELEARSHSLGLGERVVFVGEVDQQRLAALYHAAKTLVLPSVARTEMFGMVQLEAMAAGKPVISTSLPTGVPYVNRHRVTGLIVPPGDPVALAAAIREIAGDSAICAEMGRAGRDRVFEEFTFERQAKLYEDLYRELLDAPIAAA